MTHDDDLRAALRAEAASHQPDREAMLDRITSAAMSPDGAAPRSGPRARMAAAAAAVVALLAGGGVVNWALAGDTEPDRAVPTTAPSITVTTTAPSPLPSIAPTSKAVPTTQPTGKPSSRPPTRTPDEPEPPKNKAEGPLRSAGSAEPGSNTITLTTTERLTALEVVIRVARTDGLTARSGTKQTPGASVTTTVTEEPGALLYRFVMSPADVLEPGAYTFTARFRHPGDRDAAADTYTVTATPAGTAAQEVRGGFSSTVTPR